MKKTVDTVFMKKETIKVNLSCGFVFVNSLKDLAILSLY